jgi:GcrA cell cycle regulator
MRNVWTRKRVRRLVEFYNGGDELSSEIIAGMLNEQFGTTYSKKAIINKAQKIGFDRRGETGTLWPEDRRAVLVELCNDPTEISYAIITKRLNERFGTEYTRSAVIGCASRMGFRQRELPKESKVAARKVPHSPAPSKPTRIMGNSSTTSGTRQITEPIEISALRCVQIVPRNLRITELEQGDCRYAYGEEAHEITFCGHPRFRSVTGDVVRVSSYCKLHHFLSKRSGKLSNQGAAA